MFLGRQPGERISGAQLESDRKAYEYFVKKNVDKFLESAPVAQAQPQFMSLTNAEGRVIDVMVKPDGEPVVVEPKVQNTQQGMFTMANPTNAVPIIDPRTGQQLQGYAADPYAGAPSPAPLAGGGMAATNAPTAAPVQTPAPSPTPFPEGAVIRSKRDGQNYRIVNGQPVLVGP
jgi:formylmethanofuran dehydrogenase subunit D